MFVFPILSILCFSFLFLPPPRDHPTRRVDKAKISRVRLAYVETIEQNRNDAIQGRDYYLEVWTDESYVHHHHHQAFSWLGSDIDEVFERTQWKGERASVRCDVR